MANTSTSSNFGTFLTGLVVGGLVGIAAVLLLTPQSGEQIRALIRDKSIELRDRASEAQKIADERLEGIAEVEMEAGPHGHGGGP